MVQIHPGPPKRNSPPLRWDEIMKLIEIFQGVSRALELERQQADVVYQEGETVEALIGKTAPITELESLPEARIEVEPVVVSRAGDIAIPVLIPFAINRQWVEAIVVDPALLQTRLERVLRMKPAIMVQVSNDAPVYPGSHWSVGRREIRKISENFGEDI